MALQRFGRVLGAIMVMLVLALAVPALAQENAGTVDAGEVQQNAQSSDKKPVGTVGQDLAISELVKIEQEIARVNGELARLSTSAISPAALEAVEATMAELKPSEATICASDAAQQASFTRMLGSLVSRLEALSRPLPDLYPWEMNEYSDLAALCAGDLGVTLSEIEEGMRSLKERPGSEAARTGLQAELRELQERRATVLNEMSRGAAATQVSAMVPWLMLIIFGVGAAVLAGVKLFSDDVQLELISSGQIVQFVTILILLGVILALGLAEKLTGETLGTLLGGLAGYVLSQGVGRQERQRVIEAIKSVTPADGQAAGGAVVAAEQKAKPI